MKTEILTIIDKLNDEMERLGRLERFEANSHWNWEIRYERLDGATIRIKDREVWLFVPDDDAFGRHGHGQSHYKTEHRGQRWMEFLVRAAIVLITKPLPIIKPLPKEKQKILAVKLNKEDDLSVVLRNALEPVVDHAHETGTDMAQFALTAIRIIMDLVLNR